MRCCAAACCCCCCWFCWCYCAAEQQQAAVQQHTAATHRYGSKERVKNETGPQSRVLSPIPRAWWVGKVKKFTRYSVLCTHRSLQKKKKIPHFFRARKNDSSFWSSWGGGKRSSQQPRDGGGLAYPRGVATGDAPAAPPSPCLASRLLRAHSVWSKRGNPRQTMKPADDETWWCWCPSVAAVLEVYFEGKKFL